MHSWVMLVLVKLTCSDLCGNFRWPENQHFDSFPQVRTSKFSLIKLASNKLSLIKLARNLHFHSIPQLTIRGVGSGEGEKAAWVARLDLLMLTTIASMAQLCSNFSLKATCVFVSAGNSDCEGAQAAWVARLNLACAAQGVGLRLEPPLKRWLYNP